MPDACPSPSCAISLRVIRQKCRTTSSLVAQVAEEATGVSCWSLGDMCVNVSEAATLLPIHLALAKLRLQVLPAVREALRGAGAAY